MNHFLEGKITYKEFCEADAYPWINRSEEEYQRALSSIALRQGEQEGIDFLKNLEYVEDHLPSPNFQKEVGKILFRTLFPGKIQEKLKAFFHQGQGWRVYIDLFSLA